MIVVVDDEAAMVRLLERTLETAGHHVEGFTDATAALEHLANCEPDLIISDILMPEMGGHEFRTTYEERFGARGTPFVFLSALAEHQDVVKGLDGGADDYLVKPINRDVLTAKVRALLRRAPRVDRGALFRGDLAQLPFVQLLQFCERWGLTGTVAISSPPGAVTLRFEAGQMAFDDSPEDADVLAQLMDVDSGTFVIESQPVPFADIEKARLDKPAVEAPRHAPMGRLSGVRVNDRVLQLQTEYEPPPAHQIVTVVILEGRVVKKHEGQLGAQVDEQSLRRAIDEQHAWAEQMVQERIDSVVQQEPEAPDPPSSDDRNQLLEAGLEKWRQRDFRGALELLLQAQARNPEDGVLRANIEIVRRRLDTDDP